MITIFDVAKKAGVSKSTVSRVVNGTGSVKETTRERIRAAMDELGYYPNYFARGMRIKKTHSIGIIVPDYANPFYAEAFRGIESVTQKAGFMSMLCVSDADPEKEYNYILELVKREIEGIIFFSYNGDRKVIDYLLSISPQKPLVVMDPILEEEDPLSAIYVDGRGCTEEAFRYLKEKGCKKIAYIRGPEKFIATKDRYAGYLDGIDNAGLEVDPELVYEGDFSMDGGMRAVDFFFGRKSVPDAIMGTTDVMAIGALKRCKQNNIKVPGDVMIIGFDNISLADLVEPALTTVSQPIEQMGTKAAEMLVEQIESNSESVFNRIIMKGTLISRASTGD